MCDTQYEPRRCQTVSNVTTNYHDAELDQKWAGLYAGTDEWHEMSHFVTDWLPFIDSSADRGVLCNR